MGLPVFEVVVGKHGVGALGPWIMELLDVPSLL